MKKQTRKPNKSVRHSVWQTRNLCQTERKSVRPVVINFINSQNFCHSDWQALIFCQIESKSVRHFLWSDTFHNDWKKSFTITHSLPGLFFRRGTGEDTWCWSGREKIHNKYQFGEQYLSNIIYSQTCLSDPLCLQLPVLSDWF